jgi:hypothetical protein
MPESKPSHKNDVSILFGNSSNVQQKFEMNIMAGYTKTPKGLLHQADVQLHLGAFELRNSFCY